jgi:phosphate transport system substrate-binding protein
MKKLGLIQVSSCLLLLFTSCKDYYKNDYVDNTPTSGRLKVCYDEGMHLHVKNHAFTFESHYPQAHIELIQTTEDEAIQALYNDSCASIIISRLLNEKEQRAFKSKNYTPNYSGVAISGVALIANTNLPINDLTLENVTKLLTEAYDVKDSSGKVSSLNVLFDRNNSSVLHYLSDSVIKGAKFSSKCSSMNSSIDCINYVAENKNSLAFIDFAWLSDKDDSITKSNINKIKFISVNTFYPSQTTFKTKNYPFTRTVYIMRKTGDFSLAKGFESFMAGPEGQLLFLKQGLLAYRQPERIIEIKTQPMELNKNLQSK